jgi:hypothetical protein
MPRWAEGPAPSQRSRSGGTKRIRQRADGAKGPASFNELANNALLNTLALVLASGGAMLLGQTRDGGAYLVRAWVGGDHFEDYITTVAEWDEVLSGLRDAAEAAMMRGPLEAP